MGVGGEGAAEGQTVGAGLLLGDGPFLGAAGLGAEQGVATAVVYGVMVVVASLPGAAFLVLPWFRRIQLQRRPEPPLQPRVTVAVRPEGDVRA